MIYWLNTQANSINRLFIFWVVLPVLMSVTKVTQTTGILKALIAELMK